MKLISKLLVLLALSVVVLHDVYACSAIVVPLRKQFRRADSVFLAKVSRVEKHIPSAKERSQIPQFWKDFPETFKVHFDIQRTWKGSSEAERTYLTDWDMCACASRPTQFVVGEEYLVFAGHGFVSVCDAGRSDSDFTKNDMKQLSSFWFRTWATIYPF
jgi:hypothetical protein